MNKKTSLLVAALAAILLGVAAAWLLSRGAAEAEHHGQPFDPAVPVAAIGDIVAKPDAALAGDVRISGRIVRQCPASGCWFILKSDTGAELKVEMGDYTPELPRHVGHEATVEGRLIRYGDKYMFIGKAVDFRQP